MKEISVTIGTENGQLTMNFTDAEKAGNFICGALDSDDLEDISITVVKPPEPEEEVVQDENKLYSIWLNTDAGEKIKAIKCVREVTGLGLTEAKTFVEMVPRHRLLVTAATAARLDEVKNIFANAYLGLSDYEILTKSNKSYFTYGEHGSILVAYEHQPGSSING